MAKKVSFSVVIPCFNEELGVEKTVMDVLTHVKGNYEVIVVDDGSRDNTFNLASKIAREHSNVLVLKHDVNKGKRFAIDTGTNAASSDIIVHIDGDYTYPAEFINPLIKEFNKGFDMVYGSRFLGHKINMTFTHKLGNKMFSWLFSLLLFKKITDLTSGLRVLDRKKYFDLHIDSNNFGLETELMVKAVRKHWKFEEFPISLRAREGKEKLKTVQDGFRILFTLIKYRLF